MDDVRRVLARTFPGRGVAAVEPAPRGNRKETALVCFDDGGRVVVQLAPAGALATEATLARAVGQRTPVPVPRILAEGRLDGRGYVVVERAPGVDLHERFAGLPAGERVRLARTFGHYLASLHDAFAFDAYGDVIAASPPASTSASEPVEGSDGRALVATGPTDWPAWFRSYAAAGVAALPPAFDDLRPGIRTALSGADLPASPPARLYPWDLRPGNALIAGRRVTAVLDWGEPLAAVPGLALAKTTHLVADWYVDDPALEPALRAGYRSVRPLPERRRVYRIAAVVRSAVDSRGEVTRPRYPELEGEAAVDFHRERLATLLSG